MMPTEERDERDGLHTTHTPSEAQHASYRAAGASQRPRARKPIVPIAILGAALALILNGTGVGAGERATFERAKPKKSHTVTIEGMKFQPEVLTVAAGVTITWVNKDLVAHTATAADGTFDSKLIAPDKSWKLTVRKPGDFRYTCTYHPTMKGMLKVKK